MNKKVYIVLLCIPSLVSCATYSTKMSGYYKNVSHGNYQQASTSLENINELKKSHNRLLYLIEKGTTLHYSKFYDSSNYFFNLADQFLENNKASVADLTKKLTINPASTKYLGESIDPFLVHYYKALNYLYLNNTQDALVEVRRITLNNDLLKQSKAAKNFNTDVFTTILQGIIYEASNDVNNAFIAYRNAADVYLNKGGTYFGTNLPQQLKRDVLRTALQMGFSDLYNYYKNKFNSKDSTYLQAPYAEAVLFIEQGMAPVKREQNFVIFSDGWGNKDFYYLDESGSRVQIPFERDYFNFFAQRKYKLDALRSTRVAMPYYQLVTNNVEIPIVKCNQQVYTPELIENMNNIAKAIQKEKFVAELSTALARQIIKKGLEKGAEAATEAVVKNNDKSKDDKKKKENAELAGAISGLVMNVFNNATEKADTRSWLSLPAYINYVRFPLIKGMNNAEIVIGYRKYALQIDAQEKGKIYFINQRLLN